jgi:hypothetical protein
LSPANRPHWLVTEYCDPGVVGDVWVRLALDEPQYEALVVGGFVVVAVLLWNRIRMRKKPSGKPRDLRVNAAVTDKAD